jgi:hypothetical protein
VNAILGAASRLAVDRGWSVFPVNGKVPLTPHGCIDASNDLAAISEWWSRWPTAGIGVACGPSALLVVDLDGPPGVEGWRALLAGHGETRRTLTARTARGWHLYYAQPAGTVLGNSAGKLGHGVDTRGRGGYVVAPPSPHPSGGTYAWHRLMPVVECPQWLVTALAGQPPRVTPSVATPAPTTVRGHKYVSRAVAGELQRVLDAQPGSRNDTVNRAGHALGQFVGAGLLDEAAVTDALLASAQAIGLPEAEALRTIRSAVAAGALTPRKVAP